VYAADSALFHLPFVNLGLCPASACSVLLPALAGYPRAAELLMLGEPFGAAKARDVGLVTDVVSEAELLAVATAVAEKRAHKPPGALKITKQLLRRALMPQIEAALEEESKQFRALLRSPEAKEAFTAFFEKREADFSKFG
jgi:enoyl-CoA hydratase/carnithine racemase